MPEYCELKYFCNYFSIDGNDLCEVPECYNCEIYKKKRGVSDPLTDYEKCDIYEHFHSLLDCFDMIIDLWRLDVKDERPDR